MNYFKDDVSQLTDREWDTTPAEFQEVIIENISSRLFSEKSLSYMRAVIRDKVVNALVMSAQVAHTISTDQHTLDVNANDDLGDDLRKLFFPATTVADGNCLFNGIAQAIAGPEWQCQIAPILRCAAVCYCILNWDQFQSSFKANIITDADGTAYYGFNHSEFGYSHMLNVTCMYIAEKAFDEVYIYYSEILT